MVPPRATEYVKSFDLPDTEEFCIIACDIRGKSYQQVCTELHVSPETVKRNRQRAYEKILNG